jgi:phosphopantetheinyl transferase
MSDVTFPVFDAVAQRQLALAHFAATGIVVLRCATDLSDSRANVRSQVREVARDFLAERYQVPTQNVNIVSVAGTQPTCFIQLPAMPPKTLFISISHEKGLSLVGFSEKAPIGLDVLVVGEDFDFEEQQAVAQLYFGAKVAADLANARARRLIRHDLKQPLNLFLKLFLKQPINHLDTYAEEFAFCWARLEAQLKCHGLGICEFSEQREQTLSNCKAYRLDLPSPYLGVCALQIA